MSILNKAQVDELFRREAVLIGNSDVVPEFRVKALFGADASAFPGRSSVGQYRNGYGIGNYTIMYVTYQGFLSAASFYNVQQLQKEDVASE